MTFEEQKSQWAKEVRNLATGECVLRLVDDVALHHVKVKRSTPGYLKYNMATLQQHMPEVIDNMERLIEQNFESDLFLSADAIDREAEHRLNLVLNPPITIHANTSNAEGKPAGPFA